MMTTSPPEKVLQWAASAIGNDARIMSQQTLHGDLGPWLLRIVQNGNVHEIVLRSLVPNRIGARGINTGAQALLVAEEHDLPAPRLLAWDRTGEDAGDVASLETALPGVSKLLPTLNVDQLREAGAAIARTHVVQLDPQPHLPLRTRPIQVDDFARDRRWATLWHASSNKDQPEVIEAFSAFAQTSSAGALELLSGTRMTPLLHLADERVRAYDLPPEPTVLVHGDVWPGNMRWLDGICTALIDWKTAGVGNPGVDLGSLRMQVALQYGMSAPAYVLEGWEQIMGHPATHVPFWDIVAALNTPTELEGWTGLEVLGNVATTDYGRGRRDAFLRHALDRLDRQA